MTAYHSRYSFTEKVYLRANYVTATREQLLAALPSRTWDGIQNQARRMNCNGRPCNRPPHNVSSWSPANIALLRKHYPTSGAPKIVELTGLSAGAVRCAAARFGICYVAQGPKPRPDRPARRVATEKPAKVVAPRPAAPVKPVAAKPVPLLAVKRSAGTPNLNLQKESRKRAEKAGQKKGLAEAIAHHKTLRYGQPEHTAFLCGGLRGWQQWKAAQ